MKNSKSLEKRLDKVAKNLEKLADRDYSEVDVDAETGTGWDTVSVEIHDIFMTLKKLIGKINSIKYPEDNPKAGPKVKNKIVKTMQNVGHYLEEAKHKLRNLYS